MAGKLDEAKGRAKKAAGEVTGNKALKDRGRMDKAAGKAKKAVGGAAGKAKKAHRKTS
ncbi:MAG: CsbD family protein [Solirubrobacterales bacterium]